MQTNGFPYSLPLAATIDLQGRLPPPQQILFTPTIVITIAILVIGLILVFHLSRRAKQKAKQDARRAALKMTERILIKRGGSPEDVEKMLLVFTTHPKIDPASIFMSRERFNSDLAPILDKNYDFEFRHQMEAIFFPPPKEPRMAWTTQTGEHDKPAESQRTLATAQSSAAIQDLMEATLRPGTVVALAFEDVEGGFECLVMGYNEDAISVTLPAHYESLISALRPGTRIEGTLEHGATLLAFTSSVIQAVAGSMPYCRIQPWRSVWEVRKRDAVRLPASLDIDFQHISTAQTDSIKVSSLEKEPGAIRPGQLVDISLGGCCIETPSDAVFRSGDMIRFSQSLLAGNPPATLLGAIVSLASIDPAKNEGSIQRLHVQFLVIDDVSQRLLVRALRRFQEAMENDEWVQARHLVEKMKQHHIKEVDVSSSVRIAGKSK